MMKKRFVLLLLSLCLLLAACGAREDPATEGTTAPSQATVPSTAAEVPNTPQWLADTAMEEIPAGYLSACQAGGTLETFRYDCGGREKTATVYLPAGYDPQGGERYDILYLVHGAGGDHTTWLGTAWSPSQTKYLLDNMIAQGKIGPLIVVAPTLERGGREYAGTTEELASELAQYLIPAAESQYRTWAEDVSPAGLAASRNHRAIGGFSVGGAVVWYAFLEELDCFRYFLPLSGDCWVMGIMSGGWEDQGTAQALAEAAADSGYEPWDYYLFVATGTEDGFEFSLKRQLAAMEQYPEVFRFSDTGFSGGNVFFYLVQGYEHSYAAAREYLYNGLRCFFGTNP